MSYCFNAEILIGVGANERTVIGFSECGKRKKKICLREAVEREGVTEISRGSDCVVCVCLCVSLLVFVTSLAAAKI